MNTELLRHTEKLYYFYEAAQIGSFQATARKLGTTASTLSYAVKQLEDVLGGGLFTRSRTGISMTETGQELYAFCKKFFRELDDIHVATISKRRQAQRLRLGTFSSIAIYFAPILCQELKNYNRVALSIMTGRSAQLLEALLNRDIHVALTVEVGKHFDLITHELYQDYYAFYTRPEILPAEITAAWLVRQSLLFMPDASDYKGKTLANYVHLWDCGFRDHFELDSLEVVSEFTRKGLGIGILPTNVANLHRQQLRAVQLPHLPASFGKHRFFLSWRNDLDFNQKVIHRILHLAHKSAQQMGGLVVGH